MNKNYGFQIPVIEDDHYILGVAGRTQLQASILQGDGDWTDFLPEIEIQRQNGLETMNCTVYGTLNAYEILLLRKFGIKSNFSERYTGVCAKTSKTGNDPHRVAESVRKDGIIADSLLPWSKDIDEWEEYYSPNPMTRDLMNEGFKTLQKYVFGHDWVFVDGDLKNKQDMLQIALQYSPVCVSVNAWKKRKGLYYKKKGEQDNHWCTLYKYDKGKKWYIFDHYDDTHKELEWDYDFGFAKRYNIEVNTKPVKAYDFIGKIFEFAKWLVTSTADAFIDQSKKKDLVDESISRLELIKDIMEKENKTPRECLLELAKENLGRDVTPDDNVPDEVACAESVSAIIKKLSPMFPIIPATWNLNKTMMASDSFESTLDLTPGNIIISPTGLGNGKIRGHVGIILENNKIASNNSNTGKWEDGFTIDTWVRRYRGIGKLPIYVYELVDKDVKLGNMKNTTNRKFGAFTSSTDPEKMSATINGLIGAIASVLVALIGDKLPFSSEQISEIVSQLGIAISTIVTLYGLVRKGAVSLGRSIK